MKTLISHEIDDIQFIKQIILKILEKNALEKDEIKERLDHFQRKSKINLNFKNNGTNLLEEIIKVLRINQCIKNNSPAFVLTAKGQEISERNKFHPILEQIFLEI